MKYMVDGYIREDVIKHLDKYSEQEHIDILSEWCFSNGYNQKCLLIKLLRGAELSYHDIIKVVHIYDDICAGCYDDFADCHCQKDE